MKVRDQSKDLNGQIGSLRKQVRFLQCCLGGAFCLLVATGAVRAPGIIRAKGIVIEDAAGHQRILIGATSAESKWSEQNSSSIIIKNSTGQNRVVVGQEPNPVVNGKSYPRSFPGWGTLIYAPDGTERGGFNFLDGRGASISIDRPTGDAMGMLVDERDGLAAFVLNYDNGGKLGSYPTALEVGTKRGRAFIEGRNRDGSSAGSLVAIGTGRAKLSADINQDAK